MSKYRENYRGVPDQDFETMPEGDYMVEVMNSSIGNSKASNNLTWCLELEIVGQHYSGRKLWFYVGMSDKSRPIRKGTMTALGLDPEQENDLIDDVVGRRAKATIYHDVYQGKTREKVKRLRSLGQAIPEKTLEESFEPPQEDLPF